MSNKSNRNNSLANPAKLSPRDNDEGDTVRVVIETPKGSRNKYAFNEKDKVFELKKVLPAGMTFPYDFGFVPRTKGADGDPVDVLVLMDEPAFTGCVLQCRLIGIIEGQQVDKKEKERNDRLVAIEQGNHAWANVQHIDDLGKHFIRELEEFFVNYHELSDEKYEILGVKGPNQAKKCIQNGTEALHKKR